MRSMPGGTKDGLAEPRFPPNSASSISAWGTFKTLATSALIFSAQCSPVAERAYLNSHRRSPLGQRNQNFGLLPSCSTRSELAGDISRMAYGTRNLNSRSAVATIEWKTGAASKHSAARAASYSLAVIGEVIAKVFRVRSL